VEVKEAEEVIVEDLLEEAQEVAIVDNLSINLI
jgi:hypothetical protein